MTIASLIRDARTELGARVTRFRPPVATIALCLFGVLAVWVALSVLRGTEAYPAKQFAEGGAVTVASAALLAMAGALAFAAFFILEASARGRRWYWLLAGVGFAFFAMDEQLELHERVGDALKVALGAAPVFRNWNDPIVIGYGLVALVVCVCFAPEILRYPRHAELLCAGFVLYAVHTVIDVAVPGYGETKMMVEETAKLYAGACFALGMLVAVLGAARDPEATGG